MTEDWYPPKTEDIRKVYVHAKNDGDLDGLNGFYAGAGFDAWLKEELAKAWSEGFDEAMDDLGADDVNAGFGTSTNPYREDVAAEEA